MSLIERIDEALIATLGQQERAELMGEKACYLARAGEFSGADTIVRSMRAEWGDGHLPDGMVWIMLAEGLIHYFSGLREKAWDRIRRAQRLSHVYSMPRLGLLTSAWMAHIEFNKSNYSEMRNLLLGIFAERWRDYDDVCLRVAMVMGDGALNCGMREQAQRWYDLVHRTAVRAGDRLALAAIMYNRAVHGFNCLVVDGIVSSQAPNAIQLGRYALELSSAREFESIIGAKAFGQALRLTHGRYLLEIGDIDAAFEVLHALRAEELNFPLSELVSVFCAICDMSAGKAASALEIVEAVDKDRLAELDLDEALLVGSALLEIARKLGDRERINSMEIYFNTTKERYVSGRNQLAESIREFVDANASIAL